MKFGLAHVVFGLACLGSAPALADDAPKALTFSATATAEVWSNLKGGVETGTVGLTMADATLALDGTAFGHAGFSGELSMVATNGNSMSAMIGDLQTASNIENDGALHLYQAWVRQVIGEDTAVKVGILDLNADFDANDTASLFINSAHGVGPDISGSGPAGAPVWPLGTAGIVAQTKLRPDLTVQAGVFNGVPRDQDHPHAFAAIGHNRDDGVLSIGQADWIFAKDVRVAVGVWHNSAKLPALDPDTTAMVSGQTGLYGVIEGAIPGLEKTRGWIRLGGVEPKASTLSAYFGAGLVRQGLIPGRPDDLIGISVARAQLSKGARRSDENLGSAETAIELTYAVQINEHLAIQPDLQYIIHPGGDRTLDDALVIGVRLAAQLP